jgi:hypothetical protein
MGTGTAGVGQGVSVAPTDFNPNAQDSQNGQQCGPEKEQPPPNQSRSKGKRMSPQT